MKFVWDNSVTTDNDADGNETPFHVQVATQAIGHMPSLLLFPLVPFILEVALVFWWVYVAAYLYSSGQIQSFIFNMSVTPVQELQQGCDSNTMPAAVSSGALPAGGGAGPLMGLRGRLPLQLR